MIDASRVGWCFIYNVHGATFARNIGPRFVAAEIITGLWTALYAMQRRLRRVSKKKTMIQSTNFLEKNIDQNQQNQKQNNKSSCQQWNNWKISVNSIQVTGTKIFHLSMQRPFLSTGRSSAWHCVLRSRSSIKRKDKLMNQAEKFEFERRGQTTAV